MFLPVTPDVLVVPSDLVPFAKEVPIRAPAFSIRMLARRGRGIVRVRQPRKAGQGHNGRNLLHHRCGGEEKTGEGKV